MHAVEQLSSNQQGGSSVRFGLPLRGLHAPKQLEMDSSEKRSMIAVPSQSRFLSSRLSTPPSPCIRLLDRHWRSFPMRIAALAPLLAFAGHAHAYTIVAGSRCSPHSDAAAVSRRAPMAQMEMEVRSCRTVITSTPAQLACVRKSAPGMRGCFRRQAPHEFARRFCVRPGVGVYHPCRWPGRRARARHQRQ